MKSIFKHNFNLKLYQFIIIFMVLISIVFISYFYGTSKSYDDTYISEIFQNRKENFEDLTNIENLCDKHKTEIESLNNDISDIQNQINIITNYEENQTVCDEEIQNLVNQLNDLTSQKYQKEKTLKDIEYSISQN